MIYHIRLLYVYSAGSEDVLDDDFGNTVRQLCLPGLRLLHNLVKDPSSSSNKAKEGLAGSKNSRQVLGVELNPDEPGVVFEFNDFHPLALVVLANKVQSGSLETVDILGIDLVPVTVTLINGSTVKSVQRAELRPLSALLEEGGARSKAHSTAKVDLVDLRHRDDNRVRGALIELNRACTSNTANIAGILNDSSLHAKADTKVGLALGTSPVGSSNHTLGTTGSKSTRDKDTISCANLMPGLMVCFWVGFSGSLLKVGSINPDDVELSAASHGGVLQGLDDRQIRVVKGDILANQGNVNSLINMFLRSGQGLPLFPSVVTLVHKRRRDSHGVDLENLAELDKEALLLQEERNVVSRGNIVNANDLLRFDLAEHSNLIFGSLIKRLLATARNLNHNISKQCYFFLIVIGGTHQVRAQTG